MTDINDIYSRLLTPSDALIEDIAKIDGDILLLGVGGKMGPSMAKLAMDAIAIAGLKKKVLGASRFSQPGLQSELEQYGVETYPVDLLEPEQLASLPEVPNVIYLAGTKFGTTGNESLTWAMNSFLPGLVAEKFKNSKIVVFSTGNVYPLTPVIAGGATEEMAAAPVGEYAQSCLGRERIFQYQSSKYGTPLLIYRLNYANDVSYGVLLEIAKCVKEGISIDLRMGHVNVIWQKDADEIAIRSLLHCSTPAKFLNVSGPETASVRWIAGEFGKLFNLPPVFSGEEQATALLSNSAEAFNLFGYPSVSLKEMIYMIAEWLKYGGKISNKPTHFQEREGKF
ncbi:Nucleoside-diphosphate-sugar epimerase [Chitinophaga ginsengisegetis]|uniref:Nucleoside-diphosphate-sugar epimerase n=1 Tax=Chitinophaga ginsengisegetis TaxID=393003 RepID=A0A1T5PBB2_9BACT|nr:epimerase [Chitinophaga ginsengisegetis]SKD10035.1 Nucleoside-diphosphate-sugar epimerase [Chitinophaga ginsengisegetis]